MLTVSEEAYREIRKIERLRKERLITKAQLRQLTDEILEPFRQEEELRKKKQEARTQKENARREYQRKLSAIDSLYSGARRGGPTVQGGLMSLGKRK